MYSHLLDARNLPSHVLAAKHDRDQVVLNKKVTLTLGAAVQKGRIEFGRSGT
jgi:hypothetical protein